MSVAVTAKQKMPRVSHSGEVVSPVESVHYPPGCGLLTLKQMRSLALEKSAQPGFPVDELRR